MGLDQGDELLQRRGRHVARHHEQVRGQGHLRYGGKVLEHVIGHPGVQRRRLDHGRDPQQQRVAVWRRLGHHVAADDAAGARPVLHHHGLAPGLAQLLGNDAPDDVGAAACRVGNHHAQRRTGRHRLPAVQRRSAMPFPGRHPVRRWQRMPAPPAGSRVGSIPWLVSLSFGAPPSLGAVCPAAVAGSMDSVATRPSATNRRSSQNDWQKISGRDAGPAGRRPAAGRSSP